MINFIFAGKPRETRKSKSQGSSIKRLEAVDSGNQSQCKDGSKSVPFVLEILYRNKYYFVRVLISLVEIVVQH